MKTWGGRTSAVGFAIRFLCVIAIQFLNVETMSAKRSSYGEMSKNEKAVAKLQEELAKRGENFEKESGKLREQIAREKDGKKKAKLEHKLAELSAKFTKENSELLRRVSSLKNVPLEMQTRNTRSVISGGPCGNLAALTGDPRRVIESHGQPQNCEYFQSQRADLHIMSPSAELQSSSCWVGGAYVFDGPSMMIFKYFDVNPPLVIVFVDMSIVASYSYSNFNENQRDRTLLTICPPGGMQMFHSDISGWHEVNFASDPGSNYESVLANLFGAGGGGALYRGGFEGMQTTARAQMRDDFKFRSVLLDKQFVILLNNEAAIWAKISGLFGEVINPVREKIAVKEAQLLVLEREGKHRDAERSRKELRELKKKKDDLLKPMMCAERSLQSYDFANPAVRGAIGFLAKNLPDSDRNKVDGLAEEHKTAAGELRDAMEKIKPYLGREFNQEILSEPIDLAPLETIAGLVAVTGVTYDFETHDCETQKPKLKVKIQESWRPMKPNGTVDKYAPAVRDFNVVGVFIDDLLQAGFTKAKTMCKSQENRCVVSVLEGEGLSLVSALYFQDQEGVVWEEADLRDMKENRGTTWLPIGTPKKDAEVVRPPATEAFLDTFNFNDSEGHHLTVFAVIIYTMETITLIKKNGEKVELKYFPYPGVYSYEMTVVDALATDLVRRELRIPDVYFRIELPPESPQK